MIRSTSNSQIKNIKLLQKKSRARRKQEAFIIEGIKMFEESRVEGNLIMSYLSETFYNKKKEDVNFFHNLPYKVVEDSVFKEITETSTPQGILAIVKAPKYNLQDIIKSSNKLLLLEDIQDPGNLGTMVRTAEGAGFHGIILSKNSVDMLNPKVIRSTMGSIYRVPFIYVDDFQDTLHKIKKNNIKIYAAYLGGEYDYDQVDYPDKCAILIGNEGSGLQEQTAEIADFYIKIPMKGQVESLNAGVAAAIIMYEARRKEG